MKHSNTRHARQGSYPDNGIGTAHSHSTSTKLRRAQLTSDQIEDQDSIDRYCRDKDSRREWAVRNAAIAASIAGQATRLQINTFKLKF